MALNLNQAFFKFAEFFARHLPLSIKRAFYKNATLSAFIRSSLNRAAPSEFTEAKIMISGDDQLKMRLDLQNEKDYWLGTYEPELQRAIKDLIKPGQIIFDIGANIGFTSLLFAMRTGSRGHVYAFEALPENIERLKENVTLNDFQDRISIIDAAVLDRSGETSFLVGPSSGTGKVQGSAGREELEYKNHIQVRGLSIDDFVQDERGKFPEIIKIDIEGGEGFALRGMQKTLREVRPTLFIELHGPEAGQGCWEVLNSQEYRISRMDSQYTRIHQNSDLDWKSYIIAFPPGYEPE